jgi:hypothetical protein
LAKLRANRSRPSLRRDESFMNAAIRTSAVLTATEPTTKAAAHTASRFVKRSGELGACPCIERVIVASATTIRNIVFMGLPQVQA